MCKVLVFAGTTEGRKITEFLAAHKVETYVCVATEYGEELLPKGEKITVSHERLDEKQMEALMDSIDPVLVVDATHPYAAEVTQNIRMACENTKHTYERLLRENTGGTTEEGAVYVSSVEEAVSYLKGTKGNILVTTGSKEIKKYTELPDYETRVFARVLSLPKVAAQCAEYGFEGRNLICMQGPFSKDLNAAMIRQLSCKYLVTKMSGVTGGYQEKLDAAAETGCIPVIVGRPLKEEGLSFLQCRQMLCKKLGINPKRKISLVGIGMGNVETMTLQGQKALQEAELLIGARRMTEAVALEGQQVFVEYDSEKIRVYIEEHPEYEKIAIALSGDVGFYSGARKLLDSLSAYETELICGISSPVYFMSRIKKAWDDVYLTSAHGRKENLVELIRTKNKVFSILGTKDGVGRLAEKLLENGLDSVKLYVGEQLSYEKEKILSGYPKDFISYEGDPLCVIFAENPDCKPQRSTHGIKDEAFLRDRVPMTKEEIRTISLAKLGLNPDSVCYDVGAGTGSVSIEMALRTPKGKVYAIEKKEQALELLKKNKKKFGLDHLELVEGEAPDALEDLEVPTHAFIGGSSGNMKKIMELLLRKNPEIRMVINCIAAESTAEALNCVKELPVRETEIISVTVARAKKAGPYHLMMGENPITILSCTGKGKEEEKE